MLNVIALGTEKPVKRTISKIPIREQIKNILIEQILTGELKPGCRLKELHVAKEFKVSQAPVREALRSLEAMGYVQTIPNAGTRVKEFQLQELIEIYVVREALEVHAVRLGMERLKDNTEFDSFLASMELCLEQMEDALSMNDRSGYSLHNTDFHRLLIKMSQNKVMLTMWESLEVQSRVMQTMFFKNIGFLNVVKLHRPILTALNTRTVERVCDEISNHYSFITERLKDSRIKS